VKRAKRHAPPSPPKQRNPVARSPVLGKGGPHGKSIGAKRRHDHVDVSNLQRDPHTEE
jgi:hypothetical protein